MDSTSRRTPSIRTNLIWAATASPNLGFEIPLGRHFSIGANAGIKAWPRWLAWDWNVENPQKWRHILLAPEFRWWPRSVYDGFFAGADLVYTHYNVGSVRFPFGLYPEVREHRMQGDVFALGLFAGWSWWLSRHIRLEAEAGLAAGYNNGKLYECDHCGAMLDNRQGPVFIPKLGLNIAWTFGGRKTTRRTQEIRYTPIDTLVRESPVQEIAASELALPQVEEWKGVAGQLEHSHPVLRHESEYRPYTPDRILRKEKGALYVFFERSKSLLKRSFRENGQIRDNGPMLDEIIDVATRIMADTTSRVTRIQIIGLASMEGTQKLNQALSDTRAFALQKYLQDRLKIGDDRFDTVGGGEAWSELRDQINDLLLEGGSKSLTPARLRAVLDIIDNEADADRRESRIKRLENGAVYHALLLEVLQDQRNSGWLHIYYDYVPDANALRVNEGIALIEKGLYQQALAVLESVRGDSRSANAYGVALYYCGRQVEALEILQKAARGGDEAAATNYKRMQNHIDESVRVAARRRAWEESIKNIQTTL